MRGLQEIVPIQDTFASGLGAIERLDGGLYRLWFYVLQTPDNGGDGDVQEKLLVAKIVTPASAMSEAVLKMVGTSIDQTSRLIPLVGDLVN